MPPIITVTPSGWDPGLPAGMQVEGLIVSLSLQIVLIKIQGYRLQDNQIRPPELLTICLCKASLINRHFEAGLVPPAGNPLPDHKHVEGIADRRCIP